MPERRGGAVHHLGDERTLLRLRVVQVQQGEEAVSQVVCGGDAEACALLCEEEDGAGAGDENAGGLLQRGFGERGAVQRSDVGL